LDEGGEFGEEEGPEECEERAERGVEEGEARDEVEAADVEYYGLPGGHGCGMLDGRDRRTRREDETGGRNRRTGWEGEVGCGEALVGGLGRVWVFEEVRWWFVDCDPVRERGHCFRSI